MFEKWKKSSRGEGGEGGKREQGEIINEGDMPAFVGEEVEKRSLPYRSAEDNGLFRSRAVKRITLDGGKERYVVEGSVSMHGGDGQFSSESPAEIIIEVQDGRITHAEFKEEKGKE